MSPSVDCNMLTCRIQDYDFAEQLGGHVCIFKVVM